MRLAASVPNRAEFGDIIRNQLTECRRLGVTIEYGVGRVAGSSTEQQARRRHRRHGRRAAAGRGGCPRMPINVCDVRDVLDGSASPTGAVVVIDEIGFHHATSVAELLADRGCEVEMITHGMVVGQDLGITLDMENWWMRAGAKGIVQTTDLVADGHARRTTLLNLLHHPTGPT